MDLRLTAALVAGKLAIIACRILRRSGTNMPGNVAAKIDSLVLKKLSEPFFVIMVTGTNGKTTTTGMISGILAKNKVEFITNKSGANLLGGVTSLFISNVNIFGKSKKCVALIEVDEATIDRVTNYLKPDVLVVTNFFRDQLDRYGELYSTLNKVRSGILKSENVKLVLNSDDSLCASLGDTRRDTVYFGVEKTAVKNTDENNISDASFCIHCKTKYEYSYNVLGHLGGFKCPSCGYERPEAQVKCTEVLGLTTNDSDIRFSINGACFDTKINVAGFYNIYNALAAIACADVLGYPIKKSIDALYEFQNSFGRMEIIDVGDNKNIRIILAKNPTGFNQILNYLLIEKSGVHVAFLINDRVQDGTDVSWLWDVDFEKLDKMNDNLSLVYASGLRAEDMAVRLKYAGVCTYKIKTIKDYPELIGEALESLNPGGTLYIVPTYTAMLDIRGLLKEKFGLKDFWV